MHKVSLYLFYSVCFITLSLMGCSEDNDNSTPQAPEIEVDFITTLGGSKNESAQ